MSLNTLFPGENVRCNRPGLKGRVLTVDREIVVGENRSGAIVRRKRIWRVTWKTSYTNFQGVTKIITMFDDIPEHELERVGSMDYESEAVA